MFRKSLPPWVQKGPEPAFRPLSASLCTQRDTERKDIPNSKLPLRGKTTLALKHRVGLTWITEFPRTSFPTSHPTIKFHRRAADAEKITTHGAILARLRCTPLRPALARIGHASTLLCLLGFTLAEDAVLVDPSRCPHCALFDGTGRARLSFGTAPFPA